MCVWCAGARVVKMCGGHVERWKERVLHGVLQHCAASMPAAACTCIQGDACAMQQQLLLQAKQLCEVVNGYNQSWGSVCYVIIHQAVPC
jgi:hypothetical protein